MSVPSLASLLSDAVAAACAAALDTAEFAAVVRRSEHADFQADGVLPLARTLRRNPRDLAASVAAALPIGGLLADRQVAGPGFVNLTLTDRALLTQVAERLADARLGTGQPDTGSTTVIDYSQPNIAKEMHVGHLRSTIIGDALVRVLEYLGGTVIRQNHIGDWGTQFGMLIQHLTEHPAPPQDDEPSMTDSPRCTGQPGPRSTPTPPSPTAPASASSPCRPATRTPSPSGGDIVEESTRYFTDVYQRLDVRLTPDDAVGESTTTRRCPASRTTSPPPGSASTATGRCACSSTTCSVPTAPPRR